MGSADREKGNDINLVDMNLSMHLYKGNTVYKGIFNYNFMKNSIRKKNNCTLGKLIKTCLWTTIFSNSHHQNADIGHTWD